MFRKLAFLQDEEGDKGGGGGGVDAATARTFLADFAHDPEALKTLPDDQVVQWHGRVTSGIDKVRPAGGKWPETWRDEFAGGDDKVRKQLDRYAAPTDVWKKARALEQQLSSGEYKRAVPFPEKGTDDEKKAWRAEQGVPDTAAAYLEKLPEGLVIGEADKEAVTAFVERMHGKNAAPEIVHEAIAGYYAAQEAAVAAQSEQDKAWKAETEDALRSEWGNEYRGNVDRIKAFLGSTGELGSRLMNARLADGRPMFADPEFSKFFMSMVNDIEPAVSLVPNAGGNQGEAIGAEIANLKKMMGDPNSAYWKGPDAQKNQERYRKLLDGQAKLQKKAA